MKPWEWPDLGQEVQDGGLEGPLCLMWGSQNPSAPSHHSLPLPQGETIPRETGHLGSPALAPQCCHYDHFGGQGAPAEKDGQLRTYPNAGSGHALNRGGPGGWFSHSPNQFTGRHSCTLQDPQTTHLTQYIKPTTDSMQYIHPPEYTPTKPMHAQPRDVYYETYTHTDPTCNPNSVSVYTHAHTPPIYSVRFTQGF